MVPRLGTTQMRLLGSSTSLMARETVFLSALYSAASSSSVGRVLPGAHSPARMRVPELRPKLPTRR